MAAKQRAAAKAATEAQERLKQEQGHLQSARGEPAKRGPGRPPKTIASLEQLEQEAHAAHREHQRLSELRERVARSIRAIGQAYHFVDVERGVRRPGNGGLRSSWSRRATQREEGPQAKEREPAQHLADADQAVRAPHAVSQTALLLVVDLHAPLRTPSCAPRISLSWGRGRLILGRSRHTAAHAAPRVLGDHRPAAFWLHRV
jgi:hypothetical protein